RTPSTFSSRHCLRKRTGANELPEFRAVIQPSDCLIQCFFTSAIAFSCAAFSMPEACLPPPPPVESDFPQPTSPRIMATNRGAAKQERTEQFMGPTLSATAALSILHLSYFPFVSTPMKLGPVSDPSSWIVKSTFSPLGVQSSMSLSPFTW